MFAATSTYRDASSINQAMGRVYFYMMTAVLNSMIVSFLVGHNHELMQFFFTGVMKWVVLFAPLVAIFFIVPAINAEPPAPVAVGLLHSFAALMGLSMAGIFVIYSLGSIFTAFMGAAVLFGVMSMYGYFTKTDLSGIGNMCFVALIAIIIASIINIFIGSTVMQMIISAIAIIVFLGFTAYDTQTIREAVSVDDGNNVSTEVLGALNLYLDFINLFVNLLQIIGVAPGKDD
jgi:FtsH-binding integral membrane protein